MRILKITLLIIVSGLVVIFGTGFALDRPEFPGGLSKIEARNLCEETIKARSVNPASVQFSRPTDRKDVEYLFFTWGREQLQMQNGFGAMIGQAATCKVNVKTSQLVYLDMQ